MNPEKIIPADRRTIIYLAEKGILNSRQTQKALIEAGIIPEGILWRKFITMLLLTLGVVFFLSGTIFFFAYNWYLMHKFIKLGSISIILCVSIAMGFIKGYDTLAGRISWISASVMIGVFLAVFGQIYQTGADAWQLFALWSLLMAGWAFVSIYPTHWTILMIIAEIAIILAIVQTGDHYGSHIKASIAIAMINSVLYIIFELLRNRIKTLFENHWFIRLLATMAIAGFIVPISSYIFEFKQTAGYDILPGFAIVIFILIMASLLFFLERTHDLYIMAVAVFSFIVYGGAFYIKTFDVFRVESVFSFIMMGIFIVALAVGAVFIIKKVANSWE